MPDGLIEDAVMAYQIGGNNANTIVQIPKP